MKNGGGVDIIHLLCKISGEDKNAFREKYNDDFTHNKTIQKIRESYRVSREEKKN